MSPQFHLELGPFGFTVAADSKGIIFQRGSQEKTFLWEAVTGAVLVRPREGDFQYEEMQLAKAAKFLGGEIDLEKIKSIRSSIGTVHLAIRDARSRLVHEEIPIPLGDDSFLREFQSRLGARWLGEVADRQAAEKKLHLGPGFFKTVFYLLLFLGVLALVGVFGLYSLAAPALNFLSLRQMYEEFQSRDYSAFGLHLFTYIALFIFAYFLRRMWRNYRQSRSRRGARFPSNA